MPKPASTLPKPAASLPKPAASLVADAVVRSHAGPAGKLLNKAFAERNGKGHLFDKDRAQDAQRAQAAITADIDKNLYGKGL